MTAGQARRTALAVIVALVLTAWAASCVGAVMARGAQRIECQAAPAAVRATAPRGVVAPR
ncbi:MAG: hypothetical protein DYG90_03360 [Chloroflexi bacterium CFX6]|nr:hypothetical protein [Chloroflexi bacterium CFX6]